MAGKRITTELVVKAVDQYSGMIRNMSGVTGRFASNVRSEMGRLQGLRGPLRMIEDYKAAQSTFDRSAVALRRSRERVAELRREMRATSNPTKKMTQDFERAKRAAERLRLAHEKNGAELTGLQGKLRTAGINTGDLAGEQRRLAGALDAANGKFARQAERMQRLKAMQDRITAGRERMDRSLARSANLSFVGNASMGVGRRILEATTDVAERSGNQQEAFTEFQNLTGVDDARISKLRDELQDLRGVTQQSVDEMLAGLGVLVGKGMDLESALGALPATARAAFATDTSSDEMGGAGFALFDNLKVKPEELSRAYDIMAKAGKEGGFELTAMARKFPEVTAGARALGMEGLNATATLSSALQIAMKSAGSEDQAATNMANFFGKITAPDTVRKFKEFGVNVQAEMDSALKKGVDPMEHMLGVIERVTGGDAFRMGELFADKQVLDFLRAMLPNMEEYRRIKEEALGADGVVDEDFVRKMRDFNTQKGQLGESLGNLFTLPPEVLETLTAMLVRADAFVEKLIVWKKENPGFAKGLFLGAAALGAMAVAGGAMIVTASGFLGTMAVLRFGLVGLGARAAFATADLLGVGGALRGLSRLPRLAIKGLLKPLVWGASLLPVLTAKKFAKFVLGGGKLALSALVIPLKWGASLLPNFIPAMARFTAFRVAAIAEMVKISAAAAWHSAIVGGSFASGFMKFLGRWSPAAVGLGLGLGIQPTANGEATPEFLEGSKNLTQEGANREYLGTDVREGAFRRGLALPPETEQLVSRLENILNRGAVPTKSRLMKLTGQAEDLRSKILEIEGQIQKFEGGGNASALQAPLKLDLANNKSALSEIESEISNTARSSVELGRVIQEILGLEVRPNVDSSMIDEALAKIYELRAAITNVGSARVGSSPKLKPAGARAFGGPVRAGLPYLVNENTPRSEWFIPSSSGGILNVSQAQSVFRSLLPSTGSIANRPHTSFGAPHGGAQRVRAAALAALASSALVGSTASVTAASPSVGGMVDGKPKSASVEIGSISIVAPSGVSDPRGLVDLIKAELGEEVDAAFSASFTD